MRAACRTVLRIAREAVHAIEGEGIDAATGPLPPSPLDATLLDEHRLAPLAGWLQDCGSRLPDPGMGESALREALHRSKLRAMVVDKAGRQALDALRVAAIPAVALKGFDLSQRLYPEPGLRPFDDIDLLTREGDVAHAVDTLEKLGYHRPQGALPLPLLRRFHFHVAMTHPTTGCLIELHWRLMESQRMPARIDVLGGPGPESPGRAPPTLPPPLYAAYLAAHAAKHGILNRAILHREDALDFIAHPWSGNRLIWFVDLALLCKSAALAWRDIEAAAGPLGFLGDVRNSFLLLSRLFPGTLTECAPPATMAPPSVRWLESRLLGRIADQLDSVQDEVEAPPWYLRTNRVLHIRPIRLFHG